MQKETTAVLASIGLILASLSSIAYGEQYSSNRRGPPAEAYNACENMGAGEQAQFVTLRGDTVSGVCEDREGTLVLRPDNKNSSGKRRGPPPEAYSACEGKNAGDQAQFEDGRGETLIGSCEEDHGQLVLRPERS